MDFKSFDMRSLQKYVSVSPQATEDLNEFLEKLPQNTSNTMLAIVAAVWAFAGMSGLFATVQMQNLTELRAELQNAQSLQPIVPGIKNVPVPRKEIAIFVEKTRATYPDLTIKDSGSSVLITAKSTIFFGQFREAIGHVQNGGSGWRVEMSDFCVGRECPREPLSVALKINKVSVTKTR